MGIIDEINAAVKEQQEKRANFFTDRVLVPALTWTHRWGVNRFLRKREAERQKKLQLDNAVTPPKKSDHVSEIAPAPKTPAPNPSPTPPPGRHDALVRIAQGVSNSYNRGSLSRSKFYHGGNAVAR